MYNFTGPLTINGTVNLWTVLQAAGYGGNAILKRDGALFNVSTTVIAYAHFTSSGSSAPSTGTDGMPFQAGSATIPSAVYELKKGTDLATLWIHTPSSIVIKVDIGT